jgi:Skp family chaperone for outer membrane proteins
MIEDKNYVAKEVAEDILDLIKEYEEELKKLRERESELYDHLKRSFSAEQAELIKNYLSVRIDKSLRLFELDLRTRYTDEESESARDVDRLFKEYYDL